MVICVFILRMVCFLSFLRRNIKQCTQLVGKVCDIQILCKNIYCYSIIQFSQFDISFIISVLNNIWYRIIGDECGKDS